MSAKGATRSAEDKGLIAASIAVFSWGLGPLFVKAMDVSTPTVVAYRFLTGTPILILVALALGGRFSRELFRASLLAGVLLGVSMIIGFAAILNTSIANATLIGNTMPVIVVAIAKFVHHEHVRIRQMIAAAIAVLGVVVVVLGAGPSGDAGFFGDALATINVGLWTAYFLRSKKLRDHGYNAWALLASISIVATVVTVPFCLVVSEDLGAVTGPDWWYLAAMAAGPGILGHGLMTWASRHLRLTTSSLLTLGSPVVSAVGAWLWLGQSMSVMQGIGAFVVIAALGAIAVFAMASTAATPIVSDPSD